MHAFVPLRTEWNGRRELTVDVMRLKHAFGGTWRLACSAGSPFAVPSESFQTIRNDTEGANSGKRQEKRQKSLFLELSIKEQERKKRGKLTARRLIGRLLLMTFYALDEVIHSVAKMGDFASSFPSQTVSSRFLQNRCRSDPDNAHGPVNRVETVWRGRIVAVRESKSGPESGPKRSGGPVFGP